MSPDNKNEIYLLGNKLIRSVDGGKTYCPTGETILHLLPHDIRVMHLDMHAMWIDPDVIYYEHQFGEIIRKNMKTGNGVHIQPEAGKVAIQGFGTGSRHTRQKYICPEY